MSIKIVKLVFMSYSQINVSNVNHDVINAPHLKFVKSVNLHIIYSKMFVELSALNIISIYKEFVKNVMIIV